MKRSDARLTLIAVAAALCFPLAAAATLIVPVSQTRSVSAFAQVSSPGGLPSSSSFSASDFGVFNKTAFVTSYYPVGPAWYLTAGVTQNSRIEDARLRADLTGSMYYVIIGGTASIQSVYDITFDLTVQSSYVLWNAVSTEQTLEGTQVVSLRDVNGNVLAQPGQVGFPGGSPPFGGPPFGPPTTGILGPGRYRLVAQYDRTQYTDDQNPQYAYADLLFTAIPEPGTALLLMTGLLGLAYRQRRHGRAA